MSRLKPPGWLCGVMSLLVPGLGQVVAGSHARGLFILSTLAAALASISWQQMPTLLIFVAFAWLWNALDAYRVAQGAPLMVLPIVVALLAVFYTVGWHVTEIEPSALFGRAGRVEPIVTGLLTPDFVTREQNIRQEQIPFEVNCSDNPPSTFTALADDAVLSLSTSCGSVGDAVRISGRGLWPDTEVELWWVNPMGQAQRLTQAGEPIVMPTDARGMFAAGVTVPQAVPLSHDTGDPQDHAVEIRQAQIVGGWQLSENGRLVLEKMSETIAIALVATTFAVVFAVPLSFVAASNLMRANPVTITLYYIVRTLMNITRSIESLIIAIIFVVWVGLGPFAGVMALTIHSIAALGKLYSEQVESIDPGPLEAMRAAGATWAQMVVYGVFPQVFPPFLAFSIYRWDINVRTSTILGFVGGGGIGFLIVQWQRLNQWEAIGAAFWTIVIIVSLLDFASAHARARLV